MYLVVDASRIILIGTKAGADKRIRKGSDKALEAIESCKT